MADTEALAELLAERDRLRAQVEDMRTAVHSCHPGFEAFREIAESWGHE